MVSYISTSGEDGGRDRTGGQDKGEEVREETTEVLFGGDKNVDWLWMKSLAWGKRKLKTIRKPS